jgi:hypothetical protein
MITGKQKILFRQELPSGMSFGQEYHIFDIEPSSVRDG